MLWKKVSFKTCIMLCTCIIVALSIELILMWERTTNLTVYSLNLDTFKTLKDEALELQTDGLMIHNQEEETIYADFNAEIETISIAITGTQIVEGDIWIKDEGRKYGWIYGRKFCLMPGQNIASIFI